MLDTIGISPGVSQLQANGVRAAFLTEAERAELSARKASR